MGNRQRFAFGVVVTGICLVLAGCGGSGVSKSAHNALQAELDAAKSDLAQAESARQTAESARQAAETAKQTAETALTQAQTARQTAEDALTQAEADKQTAETAQQTTAQELEQAQQQVQSREANQRAEKLKVAFPGDETTALTATQIGASVSPVATAAERGRLSLTRGGYSTATLSGNGLRTATMALTAGGDSGKTVVYTDRELSRPVLVHFGNWRDAEDKTRFTLTGNGNPLTFTAITQTSTKWKISHTVPTSVSDRDVSTYDDTSMTTTTGSNNTADALEGPNSASLPKTAASFSGTLYGTSGRFVCDNGDAGCRVRVTPTFGTASNGRIPLTQVTVASVDTAGSTAGTLYFKPSGSPTLQLYEGGPVDADIQYMMFGYWREDPTSPAADYQVGAFAQAFNGGTPKALPSAFTATYDGTAVGMYVEQDPNNAVDTHRQGEFTADVFLNADETGISGSIDDFVTTPTGGSAAPRTSARWVVTLSETPSGTAANARIENLTGDKSGSWLPNYVQAHEHAADTTPGTAGAIPPAVTGTFNTRILDFVHLFGAFGAEKR